MSWTDERVETLKKLWAEGLTARQIADMMGGVTRNAIIGKVHRLGLSGRPKTVRVSRPKPRKPRVSGGRPGGKRNYVSVGATALKADVDAVALPVAEPVLEDLVIPIAERKTLLELGHKTCRWPYGDPREEEFYFCGREISPEKPYCKHHCRLAYQPLNERRRERRAAQRAQQSG